MNYEFYLLNNEIYYRASDGTSKRFEQSDTELIERVLEQIECFYPAAYAALSSEYAASKPNLRYYRWRIVSRFCRCNMSAIDNIADIDDGGELHLEWVPCPLRGECKLEGVVCRPRFNSHLSAGEERVLRLLYSGKKREEIAETLYLSLHTVNNHVKNALRRLGLHTVADFKKWAATKKVFENEI